MCRISSKAAVLRRSVSASRTRDEGILQFVEAITLSESGGTRLAVKDGRWVILSPQGTKGAGEALVALLPLLEHEPVDVVEAVSASHSEPFPWRALLVFALCGASAYWQERAVPWLDVLEASPDGALAEAARHVIKEGRCGQRYRQQLHRWLAGKPIRGL